jgi:hypothetical protein
MRKQKKQTGIVESLCRVLGRKNFASGFLDCVSGWLFPLPTTYAYNGIGALQMPKSLKNERNKLSDIHKPILMARPPAGTENFHGPAPVVPHDPHTQPTADDTGASWLLNLLPFGFLVHESIKKDAKHASVACSDPLYRGMHGAPCKYEGGSDNKCPKGTVSGWWWSYDVPGKGRIYYVDCCGGSPKHKVFCNWTNEYNWCQVFGKAQARGISDYNCTLAILEADMKVKKVGAGYEVEGVDP